MRLLNPMEAALRPIPMAAPGGYEAPAAEGTLRLVLETVSGQPPACAAEAAVRLAQAEPLLAAVEAWCGRAFEWSWAGSGEAPTGGATARWAGAGVGACLTLPWALLRQLSPPPWPLAHQLQWLPVAAELVLAVLSPAPEEQQALEPGGAVLLPASFEPDWFACLQAEGEGAAGGLRVLLDMSAGALRPCPASAAVGAEPPPKAWALSCAWPEPLPPEQLLGWRDEPLPIDLTRRVALWQHAAGVPAVCRAQGRLLPWGEGRALWIESVQGERSVDPV